MYGDEGRLQLHVGGGVLQETAASGHLGEMVIRIRVRVSVSVMFNAVSETVSTGLCTNRPLQTRREIVRMFDKETREDM
jgi:hypothetical protein